MLVFVTNQIVFLYKKLFKEQNFFQNFKCQTKKYMNYNKSGANPLNVSYAPVNDQLVIAINQNRESNTRLTRRIYQQTMLNPVFIKKKK